MFEVLQGKEVVVQAKNAIGLLSDLAKPLAEKGVSLRAMNSEVCENECIVRLVTDDNLRAVDVLNNKGLNPKEEEVILIHMLHKPGMLKRVAEIMDEAKIDIKRIYATALDSDDRCLIVLHTEDTTATALITASDRHYERQAGFSYFLE